MSGLRWWLTGMLTVVTVVILHAHGLLAPVAVVVGAAFAVAYLVGGWRRAR